MANWTHRICSSCWWDREGDRRPVRLKPEVTEEGKCCFCLQEDSSGMTYGAIFTREDPVLMECAELHEKASHG